MTKLTKTKVIDLESPQDHVTAQGYRPVDPNPPPTPAGLSVQDGLGQVVLHIDPDLDRAHRHASFKEFVAYRTRGRDSSGAPISPQEVARFSDLTKTITRVAGEPQLYWYALKSRSKNGKFSGYGDWVPGLFLNDTGIHDRFDDYGGLDQVANDGNLHWIKIGTFEIDEVWALGTLAEIVESPRREGMRSVELASELVFSSATQAKELDLSGEERFTDDDYLTAAIYVDDVTKLGYAKIQFVDSALKTAATTLTPANLATGWNYIAVKRSDLSVGTGFDWADVQWTTVIAEMDTSTIRVTVHFDDIRLVKASAIGGNSTIYNDTGDKWAFYAEDSQADNPGVWHIYTDMPNEPFALGNTQDADGTYIAVRTDRQQANATHACAIQLRDSGGRGGMLLRVADPLVTVDDPLINTMCENMRCTTVFGEKTASFDFLLPTQSYDNTYGKYVLYTASDSLWYTSITIPDSKNAFTIHMAIQPDFPSTVAGGNYYLYHHNIDANNNLALIYDTTADTWQATFNIAGGGAEVLESAAVSFAANSRHTLTLVVDDVLAILYVNGVEADRLVLSANYPASSASFYFGSSSSKTNSFTGRIYQLLIDREAIGSDTAAEWYTAIFDNQRLSEKVASLGQYHYYGLDIDTDTNLAYLYSHHVGHDVAETDGLSQSVAFSCAADQVYHLAVRAENQDNDDDGDIDQLVLTAWASDDVAALYTGDTQLFSVTIADSARPIYDGGVGFRSERANVRFGNLRAGSPGRAEEAERAVYARRAGRADEAEAHIYPATNTSGATAYAGDVGYIDDSGEYKTTTTAEDGRAQPVAVVQGAGNNSTVYVTEGPGPFTLNYIGSDPASGDYLTYSATAGKCQARSTMHPGILAQASAAGSDGRVAVRLLLRTLEIAIDYSDDIYSTHITNHVSDSDFVALIDSLPGGAAVRYDTPTSGTEDNLQPNETTHHGKLVLHNTTRGDSALISDNDTTGGTGYDGEITLTATVPGTWQAGDTITLRSQTNTSLVSNGYFIDVDLSTSSTIPALCRFVEMEMNVFDLASGGLASKVHPYEANDNSKRKSIYVLVGGGGLYTSVNLAVIPLVERKFCAAWNASGASTARFRLKMSKLFVAA